MCNWITMPYSIKLTKHCKPAIMKKKNIIFKQTNKNNENQAISKKPEYYERGKLTWLLKFPNIQKAIKHICNTQRRSFPLPNLSQVNLNPLFDHVPNLDTVFGSLSSVLAKNLLSQFS